MPVSPPAFPLRLLTLLLLGASLTLAACGQKGDLYLPDKHPDKKEQTR